MRTMSREHLPPLDPHRGESWAEWVHVIDHYGKRHIPRVGRKDPHSCVSLLPRKDILIFGVCPLIEHRVICECQKCLKVMMPTAFYSHHRERHGPNQVHTAPVVTPSTSFIKKSSKTKKKIVQPPAVPPPPLFMKQTTPPTSPIAAVTASADLSPPILQPVQIAKSGSSPPRSPAQPATNTVSNLFYCGSSNGSLVRHSKKPKKNYKKIKEFDPDRHCGVVEGHKGPCLRSITCSNHTVHLRKAVPGRSKDFHQLITEYKAAKEKELSKLNSVPSTTPTVPITVSLPVSLTASAYVPTLIPAPALAPVQPSVSIPVSLPSLLQEPSSPLPPPPPPMLLEPAASMPILDTTDSFPPYMDISTPFFDFGTVSQAFAQDSPTSTRASDFSLLTEPLHVKIDSPILDLSSQGSLDTPTSLTLMPVDELGELSPSQLLQLDGPVLRVASTQAILSPPVREPLVVTFPIPPVTNTPMYSSHPKPLVMTSSTTRKVGGTFVLQNQRIDRQRSDIQMAANTRRSINSTVVNNHHKPNILKNSTRGGNHKINNSVKRQANDRVVNDNNKHIRLNEVNGFIIHAEVNDTTPTTEAPHTNNSTPEPAEVVNLNQN